MFTFLQSELFEKLSEWHIDWQGLIDKGLAIEKQRLKEAKTILKELE